MSVTRIISDDIVFVDCDTKNEISSAIEGQKVGITIPVKNVSSSGYIILLYAQLFKGGTLIENNLIHSELYVNAGATEEWYSEFYMPSADALVTAHSYVWPDYPPSSPDYTTMVTLSLEAAVGGWIEVDTRKSTIDTGLPGGWIEVDSKEETIGVGLAGGWVMVDSGSVVVSTESIVPPPPPTPPSGEITWPWIAAGAVGVGGVLLLTGKGKTTGKKKT